MDSDRQATSAMPWSSLLGNIREYAIFTLDEHGRFDSWNRGVRELLGYDKEEFIGQPSELIFTAEDRESGAAQAEMEVARRSGEAMDDRWHVRKDGSRFWANGIMHAVHADDGALVGYLKLMRDQTEKLETEARLGRQRTLISAILDSLPGVFYVADGLSLVRWNHELERVTGLSMAELARAAPEDLLVEVDQAQKHLEYVLSGGNRPFEGHLKHKDGTIIPYLFTGHRVELDGRTLILGVGIENLDQVRSRKLLERRAQEQATFAALAASTLAPHDMREVFETAVSRVKETLAVEEVRFVPQDEVGADDGADDGAGHRIRAMLRGHGRHFGYLEARTTRNDPFSPDDTSFLMAVANLLAAAVEREQLQSELERRAETDDLTGLLKRVAFEHRLTAAIGRAERQGSKVAVMFIDLDNFKQVNDTLGHQAGDEVLKEVSRRILESVRSWDAVARHGGDEFVLFLPDIEEEPEVMSVAGRLLDVLTAPLSVAGRDIEVGATIGISTYPEDGVDAGSLLRAADWALYRGKDEGRNRLRRFQQDKSD